MKLYIYTRNVEEALKGDYRWSLMVSGDDDIGADGYILLQEIDIDLNLDRETLTGVAIDNLETEIVDIKAKTTAAITTLETRKQNLLALTHQEG